MDITQVVRSGNGLTVHSNHNLRYYCEPEDGTPKVFLRGLLQWWEYKSKRDDDPKKIAEKYDKFYFNIFPGHYYMDTSTEFMQLSCAGEDGFFYLALAFSEADATEWDSYDQNDDRDKGLRNDDPLESLNGTDSSDFRKLEDWDQGVNYQ